MDELSHNRGGIASFGQLIGLVSPMWIRERQALRIFSSIFFGIGLLAGAPLALASDVVVVDHREISVIDGDTIQFNNTVYQMAGIDAPELGQACDNGGHLWLCGLAAAYGLRKLVDLQVMPIKCFVQQRAEAMPIATCLIGEEDISDVLLNSGYVAALPNGSPHYALVEHLAKNGSLGIWGSEFIPPWKWRTGERLPNEHKFEGSSHPTQEFPWKNLERLFLRTPKAGHAACMVKGIITGKNERFYYGPLDQEYEAFDINPQKGERYFCGDDEARQAGWTRKGNNEERGASE